MARKPHPGSDDPTDDVFGLNLPCAQSKMGRRYLVLSVHSPPYALPLPTPPVLTRPGTWLCPRTVRFLLSCLPRLGLAALLALVLQPRAWDAERMLAAAQRVGPRAVAAVRALQPVLTAAADLDEEARLATVNQFFNRRILFRDDTEVWGQEDYWASPLEMFEKGAGDCEDYAIGKYFSLLALGVPNAKLRLVYVRAQLGAGVQAHMVLAYYPTPQSEPLILDNLISDLRPASRRPDLTPVFSFNSEGLWQGVGTQTAGDPTARLSRWREVLAKGRTEGFQ